jgi:DNA-binding transcriptional regulator LsrR (DeoR family)
MGMTPEQIAGKLGVSRYLVTQILLTASAQGKR